MNFTSALDRIRRWRRFGRWLAVCAFAAVAAVSIGEESNAGSPEKEFHFDDKTTKALALERSADLVVQYTGDGKLDIGIGKVTTADGQVSRTPKCFPADELVDFFDQQRHKNLLVLIFHKSSRSDDEIKSEVTRLNDYFKDRGYKRIVIQQHYASSRGTHSDITVTP
jgi:hypothetical protein